MQLDYNRVVKIDIKNNKNIGNNFTNVGKKITSNSEIDKKKYCLVHCLATSPLKSRLYEKTRQKDNNFLYSYNPGF